MKPIELAKVKNGDITYILKRYFEPQNFICSHCNVPHSEQSVGEYTQNGQKNIICKECFGLLSGTTQKNRKNESKKAAKKNVPINNQPMPQNSVVKKKTIAIDDVFYEDWTYAQKLGFRCNVCDKHKSSNHIVYAFSNGKKTKMCKHCFSNIVNNRMELQTIKNPYKKYDVGLDTPVSMMELFLKDKKLFNKIADDKKAHLKISPSLVKFFRNTKLSGESYKKDMMDLRQKWDSQNKKDKEEYIQDTSDTYDRQHMDKYILQKTLDGTIKWDVLLDSHNLQNINKKYECSFDQMQWSFSVVGFKKNYNEWHYHYELQWTNEYGEHGKLKKVSNVELLAAIEKKVSHKKQASTNPHIKPLKEGQKKKERKINNGDFVVITNLFRCFHKEHLVEEIIGVISVVDRQGKIIERKVSGAYCPKCNCYYLLTSQYKKLKENGILLCQLIDGETYYKKGKLQDFNAASESLLMQNGYNVKANNGLTDVQRQVILQNIMDNKILTPHRISSYLDMFIAQKRNMPQYKEAILKWEKDRSFVLNYKNGNKRSVNIQSIKSGK